MREIEAPNKHWRPPNVNESLRGSDMRNYGYFPLGQRCIAELIDSRSFAKQRVFQRFNIIEKPMLRILRCGSDVGEGHVKCGTVIYTQSNSLPSVFHTLRRIPSTGEERRIVIIDATQVHGVVSGCEWDDDETKEAMDLNTTGQEAFVERVNALTATKQELEAIPVRPVSGNILAELLPKQAFENTFRVPPGREYPFFRIGAMPHGNEGIPKHLQHLKEGDVIHVQGASPDMSVPHDIKTKEMDADGNIVEGADASTILLFHIALAVGWWPGCARND